MKNDILVPPIGLEGKYFLKEPLDSILNSNIIYKTYAVESIRKQENDGIDVKSIVYLGQGLTDDDYFYDLENDYPIITLINEAEQFFYIPARFLANVPEATGIYYKQKAIVLNLGFVKDDLDVDYVAEEAKDLVNTLLGVDTEPIVQELSGNIIVSYEESDANEKNRLANITNKTTCRSKLETYKTLLENYKVKIEALLDKLKDE